MQSKPEGTTEGLTVTTINEQAAQLQAAADAEKAGERAHELYEQWLNALGESARLEDEQEALHARYNASIAAYARAEKEADRIHSELRDQLREAGLVITASGLRSKDWQL